MPVVRVTGPTWAGKNYEVRVDAVIYEVVINSTADLFVPPEHLAAFQAAVSAQGDTATTRSE